MKKMWKGNHAIAEAALRGGCEFYAGYPITPQTEVMEFYHIECLNLEELLYNPKMRWLLYIWYMEHMQVE